MGSLPTPYSLPLLQKEQLTKDIYSFVFDRSTTAFAFTPGQYVSLQLDLPELDTENTSRLFSLASAPEQKNILEFLIKKSDSPFNQALRALPTGAPVTLWGPYGSFVLPEEKEQPLVFLAGGIGMTPFLSMIRSLHAAQRQRNITLFASFRMYEDIVFLAELQALSRQLPLHVIYTLTQEQSHNSWGGERGYISAALLKKYLSDVKQSHYFIAGSPAMVQAMERLLSSLEIKQNQVKREVFVGC